MSIAEFADRVDDAGRCVRHWRYGSGHRPLVEVAEGPDVFEPAFGSGEVLVRVGEIASPAAREDTIAVWAVSEESWRRAALEVAAWRLREGV